MAAIDALRSPELSAILRLATGPALNMRQFAQAAKIPTRRAPGVVKNLADLKLVAVQTTPKGATQTKSIELTAAGRRVARHVLALDALMAK